MASFTDTMSRVQQELKEHGKSKVDASEVDDSVDMAEVIVRNAASSIKLDVDVKVNEKSVSAKVVTKS